MPLRITTWNVNGIRNPFSYQPWRDKRTFAAMFDILEADIVVFQETKIQRKDLRDDMVLVPGWDCFFSLPKHKKGYSGVVIYTRQAVCCPIRAEEGITGVLCPPNSSLSFSELSPDVQIGGYPTSDQISESGNTTVDLATLDSEGRCVILEFPAFVLIGVYSPANRDETRDEFRLGFLNLLDARVRNLVAVGKRVFLTGDLNISKEELDTANAEAAMRKNSMTEIEYFSTPARRLFNHLLDDGKIYGNRDEGRERPVMWDICRGFHPMRKGMFTCWEQKVNARPGNFGSRIDYVLCSLDMKDWFLDSNIQEGLLGSDHCPVFATMKDRIVMDGKDVHVKDVMNPKGTFRNGQRMREYSLKDILPLSGKLIPEFDRRQSIRDMFTRKPTLTTESSADVDGPIVEEQNIKNRSEGFALEGDSLPSTSTVVVSTSPIKQDARLPLFESAVSSIVATPPSTLSMSNKRSLPEKSTPRSFKRVKSGSSTPGPTASGKGQQSLKGFFKPKIATTNGNTLPDAASTDLLGSQTSLQSSPETVGSPGIAQEAEENMEASTLLGTSAPIRDQQNGAGAPRSTETSPIPSSGVSTDFQADVHDPIESKESWSKLFSKPVAPRCEGHQEPCTSMLTKKSGMNCGRSFWMCARPLGPTGAKERNTQWRCQTFIWCSDWNPGAT